MNKLTFSTQVALEKITEKSGTKAMELELISNFSLGVGVYHLKTSNFARGVHYE